METPHTPFIPPTPTRQNLYPLRGIGVLGDRGKGPENLPGGYPRYSLPLITIGCIIKLVGLPLTMQQTMELQYENLECSSMIHCLMPSRITYGRIYIGFNIEVPSNSCCRCMEHSVDLSAKTFV